MYVLGIVGGIASGKSSVARLLADRGAALIDADQVGHQVLEEPEVIAALRERWGDSILDSASHVVRREVARRVFGDSPEIAAEREFLNSVTHPRIRDRLQAQLADYQSRGQEIVIMDAALLYETHWDELCDGVLFVDVPRETRLERAAGRGWSAEQFAARERSQWPVEEKRSRADWVLDNCGSRQAIARQVDQILAEKMDFSLSPSRKPSSE